MCVFSRQRTVTLSSGSQIEDSTEMIPDENVEIHSMDVGGDKQTWLYDYNRVRAHSIFFQADTSSQ